MLLTSTPCRTSLQCRSAVTATAPKSWAVARHERSASESPCVFVCRYNSPANCASWEENGVTLKPSSVNSWSSVSAGRSLAMVFLNYFGEIDAIHDRAPLRSTFSAPGSRCNSASTAEASITSRRLTARLLTSLLDQLVGQAHLQVGVTVLQPLE